MTSKDLTKDILLFRNKPYAKPDRNIELSLIGNLASLTSDNSIRKSIYREYVVFIGSLFSSISFDSYDYASEQDPTDLVLKAIQSFTKFTLDHHDVKELIDSFRYYMSVCEMLSLSVN
ncbi:MAG: hypothetical protein WCR67_01420 [Bacilli bacterium]